MASGRGKKQRIGMIDLDTGEVFEHGLPVWVNAKIKWHEGFFMSFQDAIISISEDREMTGEMLRVWLNLLGRMSFENWVTVPQAELCKALGMQKQNVSRAIRKLTEKGLILKGPKLGRTSAYKLNSNYAWKGKLKRLGEERTGQVKDFFEEAKKMQAKEQLIK